MLLILGKSLYTSSKPKSRKPRLKYGSTRMRESLKIPYDSFIGYGVETIGF